MSNLFIEKAKANKNRFPTFEDFISYSIYNYNTYLTAMNLVEIYVFDENPEEAQTSQSSD